jgi:hypothetical protein
MYFFNKNFAIAFALIFLAELVSLAGFVWPLVNSMAFFVLVIAALAVSFIKLEYGILILLVELFVGSKGYLFSLDLGGLNISIRMALWLVVISVFAAKLTVQKEIRQNYLNGLKQSGLIFYFIILFFFIAGAVINGLARGHGYLNVFFDANGWLYFLLLFPLYGIFFTVPAGERYKKVFSVFTTAVSWLSLKTFFLLYVFSHNLAFVRPIYRWVRDSGVGEITLIQGGFYRIFFQSHIYLIPAAFLFFMLLLRAFIVFRERNESGQKLKKQSIFNFYFFAFFFTLNN